MSVQVKICGLSEPETLRVAARAGADWIGFNFVPKSPRYVTLEAAASLLMGVGQAMPVALLADPDDAAVDDVVALGFAIIQLHGQETSERVGQIKNRAGVTVWKAHGIASQADLDAVARYQGIADRLLLDAKPPEGADIAGGNGLVFDWSLLRNWSSDTPWMLAGGLTPVNVAEAIAATGARAVDVSSGVERARGLKSAQLIRDFIEAAKAT